MRRAWLGVVALTVLVLPSCGNPPDGEHLAVSTGRHAQTSPASGAVRPTITQPQLHKQMLDLKPLVASGPCAPAECTRRAQSILTRTAEIRKTILDSPDRNRLRPAVDILDALTGISADQAGDPGVQRQIVEVGVELVDWLSTHVTG